MIKGLGIDIVEIDRFSRSLDKRGERLVNRLFTSGEKESCGNAVHRLAGRFAAKEAFYKALGTGLREFGWHDLEIKNNQLGAPCFCFSERLSSRLSETGVTCAHLSISHSHNYAVAQVILEE